MDRKELEQAQAAFDASIRERIEAASKAHKTCTDNDTVATVQNLLAAVACAMQSNAICTAPGGEYLPDFAMDAALETLGNSYASCMEMVETDGSALDDEPEENDLDPHGVLWPLEMAERLLGL